MKFVNQNRLNLISSLTTHHHSDHAGGNVDLVEQMKKLGKTDFRVYGGDKRVDAVTDLISHGDQIKLGDSLVINCLCTPCHTSGHVCFYVTTEDEPGVVFTGDTLFLGGCGRFFEGNAQQM